MKKLLVIAAAFALIASVVLAGTALANPAGKGFDEFGYNYQARVFVGSQTLRYRSG